MHNIVAIAALRDNYIWLIINPNRQVVVIDPGVAQPVISYLQQHQLTLAAILITHHHWDHTNGIEELVAYQAAPVYAPRADRVAQCTHPLDDHDQLTLPQLALSLTVLAIPGHTLGHIAYYGQQRLFCGDTLFAAGCGRLFEGSAKQLYHSLQRLQQLPAETLIYCAHEYTQQNLLFAHHVEPDNTAIEQRLRQVAQQRRTQQITLPSNLGLEQRTNPFLRCHTPPVQQAVAKQYQLIDPDPIVTFSHLRQWKDQF